MAHIVWYSEKMELTEKEKNTKIRFRIKKSLTYDI